MSTSGEGGIHDPLIGIDLKRIQKEIDERNNLNTGGFISGYKGSPLGGYDLELQRAAKYLNEKSIVHQPGLNEELGATAVWGSQQGEFKGRGEKDGVFGIWYGKGPGMDRTMDVFKHANAAGSSKHGGVLAILMFLHCITCKQRPSILCA